MLRNEKNFTENESVMIAQYQGLNVNELDALRKELREKGILFKITKIELLNSLKEHLKRILKSISWTNSCSNILRSYIHQKF